MNLWRVKWVLSSGWRAHGSCSLSGRAARAPIGSSVKSESLGLSPSDRRLAGNQSEAAISRSLPLATLTMRGHDQVESGCRRGHEATSWSKNGGWARCGGNWIPTNLRLPSYHFWLRIEGKTQLCTYYAFKISRKKKLEAQFHKFRQVFFSFFFLLFYHTHFLWFFDFLGYGSRLGWAFQTMMIRFSCGILMWGHVPILSRVDW